MTRAIARTGLSDFGKPTFRVGLDRLLQSLAEDANLTDEGRTAVTDNFVTRLERRLRIEAWYHHHPDVENASLAGPISITGLHRSGTTALVNMMSLDPQFRGLRHWEQREPYPPPVKGTEHTDPRRMAYADSLAKLVTARPEQMAMHLYEVDAAGEDGDLLGLEFRNAELTLPVWGFQKWWRDSDMRPTYAYHRRIALMLQSRCPPNLWLWKAPNHKIHLDAFLSAYPDARFIFTHRDPSKTVPSLISFATSLFPPGSLANTDVREIGRRIYEHTLEGMRRAVEGRRRLGDARFIDVHQCDVAQDPLGTLARIYQFLDLELVPQVRTAIAHWVESNRVGAYGEHRYAAEQFGLSVAEIRSEYAFYIRRFEVPFED
jgi:hypothetical protein